MNTSIYSLIFFSKWIIYSCIRLISICFILIFSISDSLLQETRFSDDSSPEKSQPSKIIYRNPRVYNVDYTFELCPDKDSIDPSKDLKLWIPVPREWDSQKAVKIISVEPEPHVTYEDPEHGNKIYYWDFGKVPAKDTYKVKIKYRTEVFEVFSDIDPEEIGPYDMKSKEYQLYTRSTYTININPEIRELLLTAVGNETNPYLKAKLILEFVKSKMHFKDISRERGSNIESILNFKVTDPDTGEQYFEGQCAHYSILFVALCRAAGIPARCVTGMVGWGPWIKEKDLVLRNTRHTLLTSNGLAATRLYGPMGGHIWAEFYLPEYGWIPVDPTWGQFGYQGNLKLIMSKGSDVKIGPNATKDDNGVYGDQWIPLHDGRAKAIGWGVWNISKILVANAKTLHYSDPFPADAYAEYATNLYPEGNKEERLRNWRKEQMLLLYNTLKENLNASNIFETNPRLNSSREAYLCHLLRQIVGEEKVTKIFNSYLGLRLTSGTPVSIEKFKEIAEQIYGASLEFFFKECVGNNSLPELRLENVRAEKREKNWIVQGSLIQDGKTFHIPVDLVIKTDKRKESHMILLDSNKKDFEFYATDYPEKLTVDPYFNIPTIRWMPPRLEMLWNLYPDLIVIYGSMSEAEANKTAAERFNKQFLGLDPGIIKADTDVTADDLKTRCIVLFGRPETNNITQQFRESFPVKFEKDKILWQGTTFVKPTQGVAQIIENPLDHGNTVILYAGLSGDATLKVCDTSEWKEELDGWFIIDVNASYVIYENHKKLASGDWEDTKSNLVWTFR